MTTYSLTKAMTLAAAEGRAAAIASGAVESKPVILSPEAEAKVDRLLSLVIGGFACTVATVIAVPMLLF